MEETPWKSTHESAQNKEERECILGSISRRAEGSANPGRGGAVQGSLIL